MPTRQGQGAMSPNAPKVTYYVVLFQPPPDTGGTVRPVAKLLGEEEAAIREKLATRGFEVLARYAKKPNAEGLRNQLHALGVETFIISDQDIRGHLIISAATANKGQGGIAFHDFDDKPLYVDYKDISTVTMLEVPREDGEIAILLDLHRHSTGITPRLDAELFDFPKMMETPQAGVENFLRELEIRSKAPVNRGYGSQREQLIRAVQDFASRPSFFAPPPGRLSSPYRKKELIAADLWSCLLYHKGIRS